MIQYPDSQLRIPGLPNSLGTTDANASSLCICVNKQGWQI